MNDRSRAVLVTGCSTGIGRATALLLADRGYRVYAGVRGAQRVDELSALGHDHLVPIQLDVTSDDDVGRVEQTIRDECPAGLYGLVNNAGVGLPAAVELSTLDEVRMLFEINTIAPLRLVQTFLPMLRASRGRVVNMSSLNGMLALPMVGAYSASKFALEALTDTLRVELRPWGISVSLVRPGQVQTAIFTKAREALDERIDRIPPDLHDGYAELYRRAGQFNDRGSTSWTKPERVARAVCRALESRSPRARYTVGLDARALQFAKLVVPGRVLDRAFARVMGVLKPVPDSPPPKDPHG